MYSTKRKLSDSSSITNQSISSNAHSSSAASASSSSAAAAASMSHDGATILPRGIFLSNKNKYGVRLYKRYFGIFKDKMDAIEMRDLQVILKMLLYKKKSTAERSEFLKHYGLSIDDIYKRYGISEDQNNNSVEIIMEHIAQVRGRAQELKITGIPRGIHIKRSHKYEVRISNKYSGLFENLNDAIAIRKLQVILSVFEKSIPPTMYDEYLLTYDLSTQDLYPYEIPNDIEKSIAKVNEAIIDVKARIYKEKQEHRNKKDRLNGRCKILSASHNNPDIEETSAPAPAMPELNVSEALSTVIDMNSNQTTPENSDDLIDLIELELASPTCGEVEISAVASCSSSSAAAARMSHDGTTVLPRGVMLDKSRYRVFIGKQYYGTFKNLKDAIEMRDLRVILKMLDKKSLAERSVFLERYGLSLDNICSRYGISEDENNSPKEIIMEHIAQLNGCAEVPKSTGLPRGIHMTHHNTYGVRLFNKYSGSFHNFNDAIAIRNLRVILSIFEKAIVPARRDIYLHQYGLSVQDLEPYEIPNDTEKSIAKINEAIKDLNARIYDKGAAHWHKKNKLRRTLSASGATLNIDATQTRAPVPAIAELAEFDALSAAIEMSYNSAIQEIINLLSETADQPNPADLDASAAVFDISSSSPILENPDDLPGLMELRLPSPVEADSRSTSFTGFFPSGGVKRMRSTQPIDVQGSNNNSDNDIRNTSANSSARRMYGSFRPN